MTIEKVFARRVAILVTVTLAGMSLSLGGCRHKDKGLGSMISMADPSTAPQLVSGFHAMENGAWRWTMKKFSVVLKPPVGSDQSGATLRFKMYIPDDHVNKLGPVTLSCDVNGTQLDPETLTKGGEQVYSRSVPADALKGSSVKVNFALNKAREPDASDVRELGVVAIVIGLQPK